VFGGSRAPSTPRDNSHHHVGDRTKALDNHGPSTVTKTTILATSYRSGTNHGAGFHEPPIAVQIVAIVVINYIDVDRLQRFRQESCFVQESKSHDSHSVSRGQYGIGRCDQWRGDVGDGLIKFQQHDIVSCAYHDIVRMYHNARYFPSILISRPDLFAGHVDPRPDSQDIVPFLQEILIAVPGRQDDIGGNECTAALKHPVIRNDGKIGKVGISLWVDRLATDDASLNLIQNGSSSLLQVSFRVASEETASRLRRDNGAKQQGP